MVRYSRLPQSSIFRPLDKLVDRSFRRIPPVHGLQANDAFCDVAFALGKARIRHRIKCSAVGTKEGLALGNWPCERHASASVDLGATMRLGRDNFQQTLALMIPAKGGKTGSGKRRRRCVPDVANAHPRTGAAHVPLFAAGLAPGATAAILVAVCRWPSQRLANGAGRSNWSSTRATMWLTMSSTVC